MSYGIFGVLCQSIDQGFNFLNPRFSFFLRALYLKEPSLTLVEFLQARFKNIEAGFRRCKSLIVALFPGWRSRWCLLRSRRILDFTLVLFIAALLIIDSNNLRAIDRYVDRPLLGGTAKIGRQRLISAIGGRFWLLTVDFDRWRSIEGEIDRRRSIEEEKRKRKRRRRKKKKRRRSTSHRPHRHIAHGSPARLPTISAVDSRLREKSTVSGRLREKKGRRRRRGKEERRKKRRRKNTLRRPRPSAFVARGSPACRHRPRPRAVATLARDFSPAQGERSRRRMQFRPVPLGMGRTYRSARLPVCGSPATGRFRQKSTVGGQFRSSTVD
ncbi:hypothetical protein BHE74_00053111 [Ensete ventricosum]|nr:hypothetical protein BHE74_00053111 [Ensete ventricosum]